MKWSYFFVVVIKKNLHFTICVCVDRKGIKEYVCTAKWNGNVSVSINPCRADNVKSCMKLLKLTFSLKGPVACL